MRKAVTAVLVLCLGLALTGPAMAGQMDVTTELKYLQIFIDKASEEGEYQLKLTDKYQEFKEANDLITVQKIRQFATESNLLYRGLENLNDLLIVYKLNVHENLKINKYVIKRAGESVTFIQARRDKIAEKYSEFLMQLGIDYIEELDLVLEKLTTLQQALEKSSEVR